MNGGGGGTPLKFYESRKSDGKLADGRTDRRMNGLIWMDGWTNEVRVSGRARLVRVTRRVFPPRRAPSIGGCSCTSPALSAPPHVFFSKSIFKMFSTLRRESRSFSFAKRTRDYHQPRTARKVQLAPRRMYSRLSRIDLQLMIFPNSR